jgi:hypothetical protein
VNDVVAVGVGERAGHFMGDLEGVLEGELPLSIEPLPERFSVQVRHHVVEQAVHFGGVVDREDVRMRESGRGLDLATEPLGTKGSRELGPQDLDGNVMTLEFEDSCEVDRGHPAAAELALDHVAVGEGGLQTSEQIDQAGARVWGSSIIGPGARRGQRVLDAQAQRIQCTGWVICAPRHWVRRVRITGRSARRLAAQPGPARRRAKSLLEVCERLGHRAPDVHQGTA